MSAVFRQGVRIAVAGVTGAPVISSRIDTLQLVSDASDQDREHNPHGPWQPTGGVSPAEVTTPLPPWLTVLAPDSGTPDAPTATQPVSGSTTVTPAPEQPPSYPRQPSSPQPAPPPQPSVYQSGQGGYGPAVPAGADPQLDASSRRSGLLIGLLIGLVAALAAGIGGYFIGHGSSSPVAQPHATASASPSLHVYEASQLAANRTKLTGPFAPLAEPLLSSMGGCLADTDAGGQRLNPDEIRNVFCWYGGTTVHFALYRTQDDLESERNYREGLYGLATQLMPGIEQPTTKKGGVSGKPGDYLEYAWKDDSGRALCGVWWDRDDVPMAAMRFEALCADGGLGGSWEPLRDLWRRYS
jgi:hypothetical protein